MSAPKLTAAQRQALSNVARDGWIRPSRVKHHTLISLGLIDWDCVPSGPNENKGAFKLTLAGRAALEGAK